LVFWFWFSVFSADKLFCCEPKKVVVGIFFQKNVKMHTHDETGVLFGENDSGGAFCAYVLDSNAAVAVTEQQIASSVSFRPIRIKLTEGKATIVWHLHSVVDLLLDEDDKQSASSSSADADSVLELRKNLGTRFSQGLYEMCTIMVPASYTVVKRFGKERAPKSKCKTHTENFQMCAALRRSVLFGSNAAPLAAFKCIQMPIYALRKDFLEEFANDILFVDYRNYPQFPSDGNPWPCNITLNSDTQSKAIAAITSRFSGNDVSVPKFCRGGVVEMPMASGKTVIGIHTICNLGCNAIVLASSSALLPQWKERFDTFAPSMQSKVHVLKNTSELLKLCFQKLNLTKAKFLAKARDLIQIACLQTSKRDNMTDKYIDPDYIGKHILPPKLLNDIFRDEIKVAIMLYQSVSAMQGDQCDKKIAEINEMLTQLDQHPNVSLLDDDKAIKKFNVKMLENYFHLACCSAFMKSRILTVCDEVHHVSAPTFVKAFACLNSLYTLGFSATPTRKDGKTDLIYWSVGPTCYADKTPCEQVQCKYEIHTIRPKEDDGSKKRGFSEMTCIPPIANDAEEALLEMAFANAGDDDDEQDSTMTPAMKKQRHAEATIQLDVLKSMRGDGIGGNERMKLKDLPRPSAVPNTGTAASTAASDKASAAASQYQQSAQQIARDHARTEWIVNERILRDLFNTQCKNHVLVLCQYREHVESFASFLNQGLDEARRGGYPPGFELKLAYGSTTDDITPPTEDGLRYCKRITVGTYAFVSEGFDDYTVDALINAGIVSAQFEQALGRGLRTKKVFATPPATDVETNDEDETIPTPANYVPKNLTIIDFVDLNVAFSMSCQNARLKIAKKVVNSSCLKVVRFTHTY
jgi:superfamily II DNA or RNA helicase